MSVRASTTPSDRKLFDSQNRLVESMQQLVKQQTEMNTKMQEVSEGVLRLLKEPRFNRNPVKCSFCHKLGHTSENCFKRQRIENTSKQNEQASKGTDDANSGNVQPPSQRAM